MIRSHHGRMPQIAASAYIDPQAVVIGDVSIGELSSAWPCVVIRGDVNWIRIGSRTNIQDGSILHVYKDTHPLVLADMVTVVEPIASTVVSAGIRPCTSVRIEPDPHT